MQEQTPKTMHQYRGMTTNLHGRTYTMHATDYRAVDVFAEDGSGHIGTFCYPACTPEDLDVEADHVRPVFASDELDHYPVCDKCGGEHDYVSLTTDGHVARVEALADRMERIVDGWEDGDTFELAEELAKAAELAGYPTGTVSQATMRSADLLPAFLDELAKHDAERAAKIRAEDGHTLAMVDADDRSINGVMSPEEHAEAAELVSDLFDALGEHAAPGMYFGAHPGDGSDYGYWVYAGL